MLVNLECIASSDGPVFNGGELFESRRETFVCQLYFVDSWSLGDMLPEEARD